MKKFLYDIYLKLYMKYKTSYGSFLEKSAIEISDKYFCELANNQIHQDIIARLLNQYKHSHTSTEDCTKFIYTKKLSTDFTFDKKYGKRGQLINNLFKLIIKSYVDLLPEKQKTDYNQDIEKYAKVLMKSYNKILIYNFNKYFNE